MSSSNGIFELFNFYTRYRWTASNFEDFETTMKAMVQTLGQRNPAAVVKGFDFNSATGFSLTVNSGLAIDVNGFPLFKSSNTSGISAAAPDVSNGRWSLVVARKKSTDINPIAQPTNPSNTVYLNTREEADIVVIDGTLAASPSYPSKLTGDVILFGLKLPAGAGSILSTYVDYTKSEYAFKSGEDSKYFKRFDAVVGSGRFCTHATLNDVMADSDVANISEILVTSSETINTEQVINQPNKRIMFKSGVTYTKGTATGAIRVTAINVDIQGGRFVDFSTVGNAGINFQTGADYGNVLNSRFKNCATTVLDGSVNGVNVTAIHQEA